MPPMKREDTETCVPNFGDTAFAIVDDDVEWSASASGAGTPVNAQAYVLSPPGHLYQFVQNGSKLHNQASVEAFSVNLASIKAYRSFSTNTHNVVAVASDNSLELGPETADEYVYNFDLKRALTTLVVPSSSPFLANPASLLETVLDPAAISRNLAPACVLRLQALRIGAASLFSLTVWKL